MELVDNKELILWSIMCNAQPCVISPIENFICLHRAVTYTESPAEKLITDREGGFILNIVLDILQ